MLQATGHELDLRRAGRRPVPLDLDQLRRYLKLTPAGRLRAFDHNNRVIADLVGLRTNAVYMSLGSFTVPVASIDDLIAMKLATGRPKDLAAIEELEAIKRLGAEPRGA